MPFCLVAKSSINVNRTIMLVRSCTLNEATRQPQKEGVAEEMIGGKILIVIDLIRSLYLLSY